MLGALLATYADIAVCNLHCLTATGQGILIKTGSRNRICSLLRDLA